MNFKVLHMINLPSLPSGSNQRFIPCLKVLLAAYPGWDSNQGTSVCPSGMVHTCTPNRPYQIGSTRSAPRSYLAFCFFYFGMFRSDLSIGRQQDYPSSIVTQSKHARSCFVYLTDLVDLALICKRWTQWIWRPHGPKVWKVIICNGFL